MHTLPELGYEYNALEPYIDAKTMEIHHTKHHQGYVNKTNAVLEKYPKLMAKPLEELLQNLENLSIEQTEKTSLKNNAGGHLNHSLFWKLMNPSATKNEELIKNIESTFGSIEAMKEQFNKNALSRFGSGWSWLVKDETGSLKLYSTANQDSPYLQNHTPLIGLDVWEHAYYLHYQNKRAEYVEKWWNLIKIV